MILINTLGIQDSGGITVLDKVLKECLLDKSNNYLIVCGNNKNINILYASYRDSANFTFKFFNIKNILQRLFIENITFRFLLNKYDIKLIYNFSGSAQVFLNIPQLIKLHDLSFFSKDVDHEFFAQKMYVRWFKQVFLKRLVFSIMIKLSRFLEMQSTHVKEHIEDFINISDKQLFFKSDINIAPEEFKSPKKIDLKKKLLLVYIVGPHFEAIHKNFGTFVKAALKLKNDGFNFEIVITLTKRQLHESSLWNNSLDTHTRFLGYLPKRELMAVFESNAVLISTSIVETLGLHVVEAVQSGVLVVVPNEKYSLEVYGPSVLRYDTFNADLLAEVVRSIANMGSPKLKFISTRNQKFLTSNEGSKYQSAVEIFDSILKKNGIIQYEKY